MHRQVEDELVDVFNGLLGQDILNFNLDTKKIRKFAILDYIKFLSLKIGEGNSQSKTSSYL